MRSYAAFLAILIIALFTSGCAATGTINATHVTNVQLTESNYRLVAVGISGEASASYILGASAAVGTEMRTVALARVGGADALYEAALSDLWQNFEAQYGPVEGRALALTNVRYDSDALNLIVYTRPQVGVRADVVEFIGINDIE
jgi:hypothetical protein